MGVTQRLGTFLFQRFSDLPTLPSEEWKARVCSNCCACAKPGEHQSTAEMPLITTPEIQGKNWT